MNNKISHNDIEQQYLNKNYTKSKSRILDCFGSIITFNTVINELINFFHITNFDAYKHFLYWFGIDVKTNYCILNTEENKILILPNLKYITNNSVDNELILTFNTSKILNDNNIGKLCAYITKANINIVSSDSKKQFNYFGKFIYYRYFFDVDEIELVFSL